MLMEVTLLFIICIILAPVGGFTLHAQSCHGHPLLSIPCLPVLSPMHQTQRRNSEYAPGTSPTSPSTILSLQWGRMHIAMGKDAYCRQA